MAGILCRALALLVLLGSTAWAAECQPVEENGRSLDGLVFIPSRLVPDPFTPTFVAFTTGAGYGTASGPRLDVRGVTIGERDYNVGTTGELAQLGVGVLPWLAVRAQLFATFFSGTDALSALVVGTTAQYGGGGGLTLARTFGTRARAGVTFDYLYRPSLDVLVAGAAVHALDTGRVEPDGVFTKTTSMFFAPALTGAVALTRALGLGASVGWTHRRASTNQVVSNDDAVTAGGVVNLDFGSWTPVPLALVGAYRFTSAFESERNADQEGGLGLYYTGRQHLVLGLDVTWRSLSVRPRIDASGGSGTVVVRYYWW